MNPSPRLSVTSALSRSLTWGLVMLLAGSSTLFAQARFGLNIAGLSPYATEFVFKDLVKTMGSQRKGSGFTEAQFDADGYPKSLSSGQSIELYFGNGTGQIWPVGDYHVFYEGEGTITETTGTGTLKQTVSPGHQIWTLKHGGSDYVDFAITATTSSNYLKNLRIIMPGFENSYQTDPIHPKFREHWAGMSAFRFMDWMGTNGSSTVNWNQVPSKNYISLGYNDTWGGATFPSDRYNGSPELAVELCNSFSADMWITLPHKATDDCMRSFAQLIKSKLNPNLKVYLEYSNECWNWAGGFTQTPYCRDKGVELGLTTGGALEYYVYRSGQMFKIWEDAWGSDKSRVINVFSWQTTTSNPDYWIGQAITGWYNSTKYNPAGVRPEFYANAPYIWDKDETASSVDQLFAGINDDMAVDFSIMSTQKAFADANGLQYGCYEAGQHYSSYGTNEAIDNNVYIPANRDTRMKTAYEKYLGYWKNTIGSGLMMLYNSTGTYAKWGSWGILERGDQDVTTSPKYLAVRQFVTLGATSVHTPRLTQRSTLDGNMSNFRMTENSLLLRSAGNQHGSLRLFDARGVVVREARGQGGDLVISMNHLVPGVYIAQATADRVVREARVRIVR